jgi:hypothetical protein
MRASHPRGHGAVGAAVGGTRRADRPAAQQDHPVREGVGVQDLVQVYVELAKRSDYAIHLGLTEAGMGSKGIVASSSALGILLQAGHRRHHSVSR